MSIQILRDNVYKKCELKLLDFEELQDAPSTQMHKVIRNEFAIELKKILNSFVLELSKCMSMDEKKEVALNYKNLFFSKEFKKIFKHDLHYSEEHKQEFIEGCNIIDSRTSKKFIIEKNYDLGEKSKDFYCVFLGKRGWNSWEKEFNSASYIISMNRNNKDGSTVQRYEVIDLPKELNGIPLLEIENYIQRIAILKVIFNIFEQKNKKISLTGISGIGKTFLAKHFVMHYYKNFSHIVWLYCSKGLINAITSEKGIELLDNLGLVNEFKAYSEGVFEGSSLLSLVINRLKKIEGNNLLILDNIDESIYDFEEELNLSPNWKLLTTSQERLDEFYCYQVPVFEKEAILLFYKFYSLEKDDQNLKKILSIIHFHTLTIELLAKTAQQSGIRIISILNRFIERGINIVDKIKLVTKHNKERKLKVENIEAYLDLIFDTSSLSGNELKILFNIALLQSETVVKHLFSEVFLCGNNNVKNSEILNADLENLSIKGWITESNDNLSIHSLIKNILIKRLNSHLHLTSSSIYYLANRLELFVLEDFENSLNYFKLGENIIDNTHNEKKEEFKSIARPLSIYYNHLGLHNTSMDLFNKYFSIKIEKNSIWELIENYNDLATKFFLLDKYKDALVFAEFIYDFFTQSEDPLINIKSAIKHFYELCNTKLKNTNLEKDENVNKLFDRMLKNISIFLDSARILSVSLAEKDSIERAKEIISDCLDYHEILIDGLIILIETRDNNSTIFKLKFEDRLNRYITTINDFGLVFFLNKEYDIALHYFNEVIKMQSRIKKPTKVNLYRIYRDLSSYYMTVGELDKAWDYIMKFIKVTDKIPENSPIKRVITSLNNEFELLITRENESKIGKKTLEYLNNVIEEAFLRLHKEERNFTDLITYYDIISIIHYNNKFYNEAIIYKKKGLQILKYSNEKQIEIAKSYYFIASCFLALQKCDAGLSYINKSVKILNQNPLAPKDLLASVQSIKKALVFSSSELDIVKLEILEKTQLIIASIPDLDKTNISKFIDSLLIGKLTTKEIVIAFLNLYKSENVIPNYDILIQCHSISAKICFEYLFYELAIALKLRQLGLINFFASGQMIIQLANVYEHLAGYYYAIPNYEMANTNITHAISGYRMAVEKNNQGIELDDLKTCLANAIKIQDTIKDELKKFKIIP